jgi:hypothetical protein
MAKKHGARQQKRIAKQKAKRLVKRSFLTQRHSSDPTVRLQHAEKWPIVQALAGTKLWEDGIGYLAIARQEPDGQVAFAVFLADVYCLGVKNAFWHVGSPGKFKELIQRLEQKQTLREIAPACLAKIVKGSVEYARAFGFAPHPDYRHAAMLLDGIDPAGCPDEYTFGRDGKPFYIQGPNESYEQANAISQRVQAAGGHFIVQLPAAEAERLGIAESPSDELEALDDGDSPDESP